MLKHYINLDLFSGLSILFDSSIYFPVSSYLDNAFQDLARCSVLLFHLFSRLLFKLFCIHLCICMCVHVHVCTCVEACLNGRVEVRQICSVSQTLIILHIDPTLIKTKKIGANTSVWPPDLLGSQWPFFSCPLLVHGGAHPDPLYTWLLYPQTSAGAASHPFKAFPPFKENWLTSYFLECLSYEIVCCLLMIKFK